MNLYEFILKKTYEDGAQKHVTIQIPANDEVSAALEAGRIYHKEDYELSVVSFRKVLSR